MANAFDQTEYPTREPDDLVIGNRWAWRIALPDYPVESYTLGYESVSNAASPDRFSITATDDGTDHIVEVASATTAKYEVGTYTWTAFITRDSDSERIEFRSGTVKVRPNSAVDSSDPRTFAAKMVAKLQATIEAISTNAVSSYSIGERSVTKRDLGDLRRELQYWSSARANEIDRERRARGQASSGNVRVRFS